MSGRTAGAEVAIVGGGFCGIALALQLLHRPDYAGRVVLLEPAPALGGVAYTTEQPRHLLNVPADRMSLFPDQPNDFVRFAEEAGIAEPSRQFLPRPLYGAYLKARLAEAVAKAPGRFVWERRTVQAVRPSGGGWQVTADGRALQADVVVLATGNGPPIVPGPLRALGPHPAVVTEPYLPGALAAIDRAAPVLVLGMRLTAIDILESLEAQGHTGPVYALSRRARWPAEHLSEVRWSGAPPTLGPEPEPLTADGLAAWFRAAVEDAAVAGIPWQAVADAVRPRVQRLWQRLDAEERAALLSRHRGSWEWVRHRVPEACAEALRRWEKAGWLRPVAGEVVAASVVADGLNVTLRTPEGAESQLPFGAVICGAGRLSDPRKFGGPLWRQLLNDGLVRADADGLGLLATAAGEVSGAPAGLFAVGSLLRPALYESTAVPELASQCALLAERICGGAAE